MRNELNENLKKAIYQAMHILHNIKDNSLKLKNDFIQQDVLNFYDKDTVVPYSPVSAKGPWIVDKNKLNSKSKNTPIENRKLQGQVLKTFVKGELAYERF